MSTRKCIFLLGILASSLSANAQLLSPSVVASGGFYFSNPLIPVTLSVTIGEPLVTTQSNGTLILTRGFQQPNDVISGPLDGEDAVITIFPNPTIDVINIEVESFVGGGTYEVDVYDILGRQMRLTLDEGQPFRANTRKQINMSFLAAGVYLVKVSSVNSKFAKSFKINKV